MSKEISDSENAFGAAAYGGKNWVGRTESHQQEIGTIWSKSQLSNEFAPLTAVLMHRPGDELLISEDETDKSLMLATLDLQKARQQHDGITDIYRRENIEVHLVDPVNLPPPNQMFCADLCAMTPQGAILARPAGLVRAGEERNVARRLADLGIPILRSLTGDGVFEGADLMWLDSTTAIIARGHRTNQLAIDQIRSTLEEIGCELISVDLPFGTMHLMGMMRIVDQDLAFCWPRRTPLAAVNALRDHGYEVSFPSLTDNPASYRAMNFVTLGPRKILLAAGLDPFEIHFQQLGIEVLTTDISELAKAAGNIGCLTSVLSRKGG